MARVLSAPTLHELDRAATSRLPNRPMSRGCSPSPYSGRATSNSRSTSCGRNSPCTSSVTRMRPASATGRAPATRGRTSTVACKAMMIGPEVAMATAPPPSFFAQPLPTVMSGRMLSHRFAADMVFESNLTASACYNLYGAQQHQAPTLTSTPEDVATTTTAATAAVASSIGMSAFADVSAVADIKGLAACLATPLEPGTGIASPGTIARATGLTAAGTRSVVQMNQANEIVQTVDRYGDWVRRSRRVRRLQQKGILAHLGGSAVANRSVDDGWLDADDDLADVLPESLSLKAHDDMLYDPSEKHMSQAAYIHCPI